MDSEWAAQSITEFARSEFVLPGKELDAVAQTGCSFDRHAQPEGHVVDIDPALLRQERLLAEDPEMPAAAGHLQGRGNAIEFQLALELAKVEEGIVIIGVNGDPFTALRLWVDGVKADGNPSGQVFADCG